MAFSSSSLPFFDLCNKAVIDLKNFGINKLEFA